VLKEYLFWHPKKSWIVYSLERFINQMHLSINTFNDFSEEDFFSKERFATVLERHTRVLRTKSPENFYVGKMVWNEFNATRSNC
jgi:hypothetical protein